MNSERRAILRQLFLIRYTSLLKRLRATENITEEQHETLIKNLLRIDWIDTQLNKVKPLSFS